MAPFLHLNPLSKTPPSPSTNHESDIYLLPAIGAIQLRAWLEVGLWQALYPGPPSTHPGIIEANVTRHRKALLEDPSYRITSCVGCYEPEVGEEWKVVGFVKYRVCEAAKKPAAAGITNGAGSDAAGEAATTIVPEKPELEKRVFPEGTNPGMAAWLWSAIVERRARIERELGDHLFVDILATDPNWQRVGAGTMLMEEVCAEADRRGWPAWLEGTQEGRALYEKMGFVGKEEFWVDLGRWAGGGDKGEGWRGEGAKEGEGEGWYLLLIMVREPRTKGGRGQ